MNKVTSSEAYEAWKRQIMKKTYPDEPIPAKKEYEENKLVRFAVQQIGSISKLAKLVNVSKGHMNNVLKGYNALSKPLEDKINEQIKIFNEKLIKQR